LSESLQNAIASLQVFIRLSHSFCSKGPSPERSSCWQNRMASSRWNAIRSNAIAISFSVNFHRYAHLPILDHLEKITAHYKKDVGCDRLSWITLWFTNGTLKDGFIRMFAIPTIFNFGCLLFFTTKGRVSIRGIPALALWQLRKLFEKYTSYSAILSWSRSWRLPKEINEKGQDHFWPLSSQL